MRRLPLLAAAWLGLAAAYGVTPLRVEQGATWSRQFEARRDLTGCTLGMEIRASAGGALYAAPSVTLTDAARGQFTASLTATQTEALGWSGLAAWDVEAACSGGVVLRLFEGTAELTRQVTVGEVAPGSWPVGAGGPGELYLRTADAASTYVPKAGTGKEITIAGDGQRLRFTANSDNHIAMFRRYANPAGPEWDYGLVIGSQGNLLTDSSILISGTHAASPDVDGYYLPQWPNVTAVNPAMLGIWGDVVGPSIVSRVAPLSTTGYHFLALDRDGDLRWSVDEDGGLRWGETASTNTHTSLDTRLYRTGAAALRTNAALTIDGLTTTAAVTTPAGSALTLTSSMTTGSGATAFSFEKPNLGGDNLLRIRNGNDTALNFDANGALDVYQGLSYATAWKVGVLPAFTSYPGIWFGPSTPSISNYAFLFDPGGGGQTLLNGAAGIGLRINNATVASLSSSQLAMAAGKHFIPEVVVSAAPSLSTCDSALRGALAYVDDTNDGAVSRMCFCGTAADDTTYAWRRADAPATTCP